VVDEQPDAFVAVSVTVCVPGIDHFTVRLFPELLEITPPLKSQLIASLPAYVNVTAAPTFTEVAEAVNAEFAALLTVALTAVRELSYEPDL
jgi:hypothetical protein